MSRNRFLPIVPARVIVAPRTLVSITAGTGIAFPNRARLTALSAAHVVAAVPDGPMSRLFPAPPTTSAETTEASPSLSAAEALAATPFFCELSAVDLARLVPDLEEHFHAPGDVVFHQGDPGDGFYVIRSGAVDVIVTEAGGGQVVTRLEAPAHFGETSLLTDESRSSTVLATTPLVLWKLPRERFDALLLDHPRVALSIAAELSHRLTEATRQLSTTRQQIGRQPFDRGVQERQTRDIRHRTDPAAQNWLRHCLAKGGNRGASSAEYGS